MKGVGGLKCCRQNIIKILTHGCGGEGEGDLLDSAVDCCLLGVEAPDLAFLLQRTALKGALSSPLSAAVVGHRAFSGSTGPRAAVRAVLSEEQ